MKIRGLIGLALLASACAEQGGPLASLSLDGGGGQCVDGDRDGYGPGCDRGADCDDADRGIHTGCQRCAAPSEGCACDHATPAATCFLDKTTDDDGTVMCHEGTRYCRSGLWSGCESIFSYPRPEQSLEQGLVILTDGGPERCTDCSVNCFVLRDNLDPVDGGTTVNSTEGVTYGSGGGVSLTPITPPPDPVQDAGTIDTSNCKPGFAPDHDCDGLLDNLDPYPLEKPFQTANPTIFLNIGPGETQTGVIDLKFHLNTVDVYFLLDQTNTMQSVRNKIKSAMTSGSFLDASIECADTDADGQPNDELRSQGIIGSVSCLMRNANYGLGFVREIPFAPYGDDDEITFKHLMDIGANPSTAFDAFAQMDIDRDIDWADGQAMALYSLATGEGLYMGLDKPGVLPRVGCPAGRWGYPCFRDDAIPVIVLLTDSAMHNGSPLASIDYRYDSANLDITAGTTAAYFVVPTTNETFGTAYDLGNLTAKRLSFVGTTEGMTADIGASIMSCMPAVTTDNRADATFTFEVDTAKTIHFSTDGTTFNSALGLYTHVASNATSRTSNNTNEESETVFDLADQYRSWNQVTGNTSSMQANYDSGAVGCGADASSPDAVYSFTLSQPAQLTLDASGSSFGTAIGLYKDVVPAGTTYKAVTNINDDFASAQALGDAYQRVFSTTGATTNVGTVDADYLGSQLGCGAADAAPDAMYSFQVSQPTRLRFDTLGSSFDTVLSIGNGDLGTRTDVNVANTNDTQSTAKAVGDMVGKWYRYSGSTQPLVANFRDTFVGCSSTTSSPDAVYTFTLSSATRVRLNTVGSVLDTVLSLHDGDIDPVVTTTLSANTNETSATATGAYDLGTMDGKWKEYTGGTTASMAADYDDSVIGCNAVTAGRDAVFKFDLSAPTTVHIDTVGSSFDTVLSLHDAAMPRDTITAIGSVETYAVGAVNGTSKVFTGSTTGRTADWGGYAMGCSAADAAPDTQFTFTLSAEASIEISTEGSAYDTVLGLFPSSVTDPKKPAASALATNNNEAITSNPKDVGTLDGLWKVYSGTTKFMSNHHGAFGCGAAASAPDAVYKFTLSTARTVTVDTISSAYNTVIGLYNAAGVYQSKCDDDSGGGAVSSLTFSSLAAGTYYIVLSGHNGGDKGAYVISFRDHAVSNVTSCDNDTVAPAGASKLTLVNLAAGTYNILLRSTSTTVGNFRIRFRDLGFIASHHRVACDDDTAGSGKSEIEQPLNAGTYYVVVKGKSSTDNGSYKLSVRDMLSSGASSHRVTCNDNDAAVTSSLIEESLPAGTYHVVVKGKSSTGAAYYLELQDVQPSGLGATLACNDNDAAVTTSMIERDFTTAGTYYLFVKGKTAGDKGAYNVNIRDVTSTATTPTYCSGSGGTGGAALIDENLTAGTYYAILKGKTAGAAGAYSLTVRDAATASRQQLECTTSASFSKALTKGTYDLVLKGIADDQKGTYALTVGGGGTQSAKFQPPAWSETLAALKAKDIHVMSVLNCHDEGGHGDGRDCSQAIENATVMANATDTLNTALEPLVVNLDNIKGDGVAETVVQKLRELSGYLAMNVSVRVVFDPDPNPGFVVDVKAIDAPGNGCDGVVGVEFQQCVPGAQPTFNIDFTNPLNAPVPLNPADKNGGYYFRAELIANGKYLVDAVPIYVVPKDVVELPPPPPALPTSGSYWQDLPSAGCTGDENLVPDWHDLSWRADVPVGTKVTFDACSGVSAEALDSCTYAPIATLSGVKACTSDADCSAGYCASNNVCQVITAGVCNADSDCPLPSTCIDLQCTFPGQPVYVGQALSETSGNYQPFLRMRVTLYSNQAAVTAPIVYDWALTYYCVSRL